MANPRLGHKKSRNGCMQCKKRRVKCDEGRPCSNCKRHRASCSLLMTPLPQLKDGLRQQIPIQPKTSPPPIGVITPLQQPSPTPTLLAPSPYQDFINFVSADAPSTSSWMTDLELLHHYTTSTCFTVVETPSRLQVFQVVLPQLGFQHDFLMHGILAFSAMHMSYLHPEHRSMYSMAIQYHEKIAITEFRNALCNVTQENAHALFAHVSLLALFPFAQHTAAHLAGLPLSVIDVANSFSLVQGTKALLHNPSFYNVHRTGPLRALLQLPNPLPDSSLNTVFALEMNKLDTLNTEIVTSCPVSQIACSVGISCLRSTYAQVCADPSCKELAVWCWPGTLPPAFLDLIRQRHVMALVILGNFAALAHHVGEAWFLQGWGHAVMACVLDALEPGQRGWLGEAVRWVEEGADVF